MKILKAWKNKKKDQDMLLPAKALRFEAIKTGAKVNYLRLELIQLTKRKVKARDLPLIPLFSN
jgi:hypothetical protein